MSRWERAVLEAAALDQELDDGKPAILRRQQGQRVEPELTGQRQAVRLHLMRNTVHLVSARDCLERSPPRGGC